MSILPFPRALAVFCVFWLAPLFNVNASAPTKEEIAETTAWFETLGFPDPSGKAYVEIEFGKAQVGSKRVDGPKVRGFLMAEDEKYFTLLGDGTAGGSEPFREWGWPFMVEQYAKTPAETPEQSKVVLRRLDLGTAVAELIAEARRPKEREEEWRSNFGRKASARTCQFFLARCLARQGRQDLADQLDAELPKFAPLQRGRDAEEVPFRRSIEVEIAHALMWKAVVDFGNPRITRPELLARFERITGDFPESEHRAKATTFTEMLRRMIAEDEEHARTAKPLETMNAREKAAEYIFRLRDQNGQQWSQPGACDIFQDESGKEDSPAHQLVKLGHAAVPALIEALEDARLTRSVGYHRDFYFSHHVLTVGDCAEAILSRIGGRSFWQAQTTSSAMQKDGRAKATRMAVEEWWKSVQSKGEKVTLIESTQKGGDDSPEQARRLAAMDTAAALKAIPEGIRATKSHWVRTQLVEVLATIKGKDAETALEREMKRCPSLGGRVAAATALLRRGKPGPVPEMVEAWKRWKPVARTGFSGDEEDSADSLLAFLGTCGDPAGIQALEARFGELPTTVKGQIMDVLSGTSFRSEPALGPNVPLSPEFEARAEALLARALDDVAVQYGTFISGESVSLRHPRICDLAAKALAVRWPAKYLFKSAPTRIERDAQIAVARNTWRAAQKLEPIPAPRREARAEVAQEPNVISSLSWSGGPPLAKLPLAEGQPFTPEKYVEAIMALRRELPKSIAGFDFIAERTQDGRGFDVKVAWVSAAQSKAESGFGSGAGWAHQIDIALDDDSLHNSGGSGSLEHYAEASAYEAEKRAVAKALAAPADRAISIFFATRRGSE